MTAGVEATITITARAQQIGTTTDFGTPRSPAVLDIIKSLAAGTDADNKANLLAAAEVTLTTGQSTSLDVYGSLTTGLGGSVIPAEIIAIILEADVDNTTALTFFGNASNAFNGPLGGTTPTVTLKGGGVCLFYDPDGWTVTDSTGDVLKTVNASGASAIYRYFIIGRTTAS